MRRLLVLIAATATVLAVPVRGEAWGFDAHKFIMERAIPLLPAEIRPFFEKFRTTIVEHVIDPDLWRTAGWEEEPPRHFVDLDAYGAYPFKELPRDYDEAVRRYGREFVQKNGTLPWRSEEIYRKLVEAFAQKTPYARENIKFFSSVIGHYGADAHVPFHAALNYDGQLTGQWGIHSRFESELFLRYRDRLRVAPGALLNVPDARAFIFDTLVASFPFVQPILEADRSAVQGRDLYDDEYFERFLGKVQPILERRLAESMTHTASLITSAWIAAGRPALPLEETRTPRKVRRS
jgi:hypothetical protein